jgi:hypothetical protein
MPAPKAHGPVEVTVEIDGNELVVGMLWVHARGQQSATFRYTDEYLRDPLAYELDPAGPGITLSANSSAGSYPDDDLAPTPRRQRQVHQVARQTIPSPRLASTPTRLPRRYLGDLIERYCVRTESLASGCPRV